MVTKGQQLSVGDCERGVYGRCWPAKDVVRPEQPVQRGRVGAGKRTAAFRVAVIACHAALTELSA